MPGFVSTTLTICCPKTLFLRNAISTLTHAPTPTGNSLAAPSFPDVDRTPYTYSSFVVNTDRRFQRFADLALPLATTVAKRALREVGVKPSDVGRIVVVTSTGVGGHDAIWCCVFFWLGGDVRGRKGCGGDGGGGRGRGVGACAGLAMCWCRVVGFWGAVFVCVCACVCLFYFFLLRLVTVFYCFLVRFVSSSLLLHCDVNVFVNEADGYDTPRVC